MFPEMSFSTPFFQINKMTIQNSADFAISQESENGKKHSLRRCCFDWDTFLNLLGRSGRRVRGRRQGSKGQVNNTHWFARRQDFSIWWRQSSKDDIQGDSPLLVQFGPGGPLAFFMILFLKVSNFCSHPKPFQTHILWKVMNIFSTFTLVVICSLAVCTGPFCQCHLGKVTE